VKPKARKPQAFQAPVDVGLPQDDTSRVAGGIRSRKSPEGAFKGTRSRAALLRSEQSANLLRIVEALLDILDMIDTGPSPVRVRLRTLLGELRPSIADATSVAWDLEEDETPGA